MIMQDCKYRLPCGRCDKHGGTCEVVEYNLKKNTNDICDHEWFKYKDKETEWDYICCSKCGKTMRLCT